MSAPKPPDSMEIFTLLQEAFSANTSDAAQSRALLAAHVTSNLLLAERVEDLRVTLELLVNQMQRRRVSGNSNGSQGSSSRSEPGER